MTEPINNALTTRQKLALFRSCFTGRTDVYGTYDPTSGRAWKVDRPVTDRVLLEHLLGQRPYGVYLLQRADVRAAAIDIDRDDLELVRRCLDRLAHDGLCGYTERSKRKGYHIWLFFDQPVPAASTRLVLGKVLQDIGAPGLEVFPKQDRLEPGQTGNFINAPLFGQLVPQGRTVFLDLRKGWEPYADQWSLLEQIRRVTSDQLRELAEANDLQLTVSDRPLLSTPVKPTITPTNTYGLPPCAVSILNQGVTENQRVVCFRLAVHLRRLGFPEDLARVVLLAWARKNQPSGGKRIITDDEVARQTRDGYSGRYRGYGCDDPVIASHCQGRCPVRQHPPS